MYDYLDRENFKSLSPDKKETNPLNVKKSKRYKNEIEKIGQTYLKVNERKNRI